MLSTVALILLLLCIAIPATHQSSDDCFYLPGHPGKKCYEAQHQVHTCCPLHERCMNGTCFSLGVTQAPKLLSTEDMIFVGVSVAVVALLCIAVLGMYWHHRQMKRAQTKANLLTSLSTSASSSSRTSSSAGFRIHSSGSRGKSSPLDSSSATA